MISKSAESKSVSGFTAICSGLHPKSFFFPHTFQSYTSTTDKASWRCFSIGSLLYSRTDIPSDSYFSIKNGSYFTTWSARSTVVLLTSSKYQNNNPNLPLWDGLLDLYCFETFIDLPENSSTFQRTIGKKTIHQIESEVDRCRSIATTAKYSCSADRSDSLSLFLCVSQELAVDMTTLNVQEACLLP